MAVFGFFASILWIFVIAGAKHWQAKWEQRLRDFEKEVFPKFEFFAASTERIEEDAKKGLGFYGGNPVKNFAYKLAIWKPSVTFCMMLLAFLFLVGWVALAVIAGWASASMPMRRFP